MANFHAIHQFAEAASMCSRNMKNWLPGTRVSPSNDLEMHNPQLQPQLTTKPVVCIRNGCKYYGSNSNPLVVLDGLNMTISKGTIYGLLGASGCGKTTLLGCILGQKKLNSGQIWVLGGSPGTKGSGVPGPRIGYMPQDTGLYGDFTIQETFTYFGWISGLNSKQILERSERLTKLLMLPETNQRVNTLSGGEQRRVSFASVLLHQPELLILDEPTVGLDPILREIIWNHLLDISRENNTTIIMTTHYIEEVRRAHIVGLMRGGELLAEDEPGKLLAEYRTETLEEAFLKLSFSQNLNGQKSSLKKHGEDNAFSVTYVDGNTTSFELSASNPHCTLSNPNDNQILFTSNEKSTIQVTNYLPNLRSNRLKALIWKNVLWWKRNIGILTLSLVLSVLIVVLTCLCIGADPRDVPVAVVNYETNNTDNCNSTLTCSSTYISCNYFEYLKKHSITLVYYTSEDDVKESVLHGDTYAGIIIPYNYTAALRSRIDDWQNSNPWDIEYSNIQVLQDNSNIQITNYLKLRLYDAFHSLVNNYLQACGLNPKILSIPIKWEIPVYGLQYPKATDVIFAATLLAMIFLLATLLTSCALLVDKSEASLERTFAMGITTTELLIAHIVSELGITIAQSILAITTAFAIFDVVHRGSTVLVLLLTSLTGFSGICYGILISCICDSLVGVNLFALSCCLPTLALCGSLWPVEGMHHLLQPIATVLPLTKAVGSMNSILMRNWDLSSTIVYMGFGSVTIWTIIFLILSIIVLKYKNG